MTSTEPRQSMFREVNGREVYDNGVDAPIWRCPHCRWWREWADERCLACGAPGPTMQIEPAVAAR